MILLNKINKMQNKQTKLKIQKIIKIIRTSLVNMRTNNNFSSKINNNPEESFMIILI